MKRFYCPLLLSVLCLPLLLIACGDDDDDNPAGPTTITSYDQSHGWDCTTSESCQDVFNIQFAANSTVTIQATDVTGDSIVQLALYGPGVALGGTNLLTGTTSELRCGIISDCTSLPDGQAVTDFAVVAAGTYRLAITRDWNESCGSSGTYRLVIDSDKGFHTPARTVNDVASLAAGTECP